MISPEALKTSVDILSITPIIIPLAMAFSGKVRDQAIGRAGNRSEISGAEPKGYSLHVMHKDHTKDETYDTVERALVVTPPEHLIYHRIHKGRAKEIGLTEEDNDSAITLLASIIAKLGLK